MLKWPTKIVTMAALLSASLFSTAASAANSPGDLRDLDGVRGSFAENALQDRGYRLARNSGASAFWWNSSSKTCANVYVDDGRVQAIDTATAKDCGKGGGGGDGTAAAVVGALLVGAIVASAASSKHKDHYDDGYGRHSYSPHDGVKCFPREAACYKYGEFSAKWTRKEF